MNVRLCIFSVVMAFFGGTYAGDNGAGPAESVSAPALKASVLGLQQFKPSKNNSYFSNIMFNGIFGGAFLKPSHMARSKYNEESTSADLASKVQAVSDIVLRLGRAPGAQTPSERGALRNALLEQLKVIPFDQFEKDANAAGELKRIPLFETAQRYVEFTQIAFPEEFDQNDDDSVAKIAHYLDQIVIHVYPLGCEPRSSLCDLMANGFGPRVKMADGKQKALALYARLNFKSRQVRFVAHKRKPGESVGDPVRTFVRGS